MTASVEASRDSIPPVRCEQPAFLHRIHELPISDCRPRKHDGIFVKYS